MIGSNRETWKQQGSDSTLRHSLQFPQLDPHWPLHGQQLVLWDCFELRIEGKTNISSPPSRLLTSPTTASFFHHLLPLSEVAGRIIERILCFFSCAQKLKGCSYTYRHDTPYLTLFEGPIVWLIRGPFIWLSGTSLCCFHKP